MVVILINVTIGAAQEYKASKALEALLTLTVPKVYLNHYILTMFRLL